MSETVMGVLNVLRSLTATRAGQSGSLQNRVLMITCVVRRGPLPHEAPADVETDKRSWRIGD